MTFGDTDLVDTGRFPKLELPADFHGIDLSALTRRIDFGKMTGVLEGNIEDLELFRGVPLRFSARIETMPQKGVPRAVDVKAVNNITILDTGQRARFSIAASRSFSIATLTSALGSTGDSLAMS